MRAGDDGLERPFDPGAVFVREDSAGKSLIVWLPCPATCVSTLWSLNNGMTISWANKSVARGFETFHDALSLEERGDPNSMPIIRPLPRTDLISSWRRDISSNDAAAVRRMRADLSISRSDSITSRVASPAAMARSFFENVDPCTTARAMRVEDFVENPFVSQNGADRHVPAGQRFGEQYHIRFDTPVLAREKPAGPAEPGLDFVGNEQGSVFSAKGNAPWR